MIVAIDGTAGSGKGTISKLVAGRLGFTYIDTGAMYRCITLKMINNDIKPDDNEAIAKLFEDTTIEFENELDEEGNFVQRVFLDGNDVSHDIRTEAVSSLVSPYSKNVVMRTKLVDMQRNYAKNGDVIMEGRDITTIVFPNAELKIYFDASVEERANRRYKENIAKGIDTTYEKVLENIKERDYLDMNNDVAPMKVADGAVVIDTTALSIEEVFEKVKELIINKQNEVQD